MFQKKADIDDFQLAFAPSLSQSTILRKRTQRCQNYEEQRGHFAKQPFPADDSVDLCVYKRAYIYVCAKYVKSCVYVWTCLHRCAQVYSVLHVCRENKTYMDVFVSMNQQNIALELNGHMEEGGEKVVQTKMQIGSIVGILWWSHSSLPMQCTTLTLILSVFSCTAHQRNGVGRETGRYSVSTGRYMHVCTVQHCVCE